MYLKWNILQFRIIELNHTETRINCKQIHKTIFTEFANATASSSVLPKRPQKITASGWREN